MNEVLYDTPFRVCIIKEILCEIPRRFSYEPKIVKLSAIDLIKNTGAEAYKRRVLLFSC